MTKVKMSDITSGSEKVKDVFRNSMETRMKDGWLQKRSFSSEELIEIFEIENGIEYHRDKRYFYQKLIKSQKGPFSIEVFRTFVNNLFEVDSLLDLIEKTPNILTDDDKNNWITYITTTSASWAVSRCFMNGLAKDYGIDIYKNPFNVNIAGLVIRSSLSKMDLGDFLFGILDSMTKDEIQNWYDDSLKSTYVTTVMFVLTKYQNTPPNILVDYYERPSTDKYNREALVQHENFPFEAKLKLFRETGNPMFLSKKAYSWLVF